MGLFLLGVASPGPNFLVVVERSMASGFRAGFVTALGVAAGDALYAAAGLLGVAAVVSRTGWVFAGVKILGGLYIVWIGGRMIAESRRNPEPAIRSRPEAAGEIRCFRRGLLTDLSNPKTIVFFTSIFAATYEPGAPGWVLSGTWIGIVASSIAWRTGLVLAFSRRSVRHLYGRFHRSVRALFGAALVLLGARLALSNR